MQFKAWPLKQNSAARCAHQTTGALSCSPVIAKLLGEARGVTAWLDKIYHHNFNQQLGPLEASRQIPT